MGHTRHIEGTVMIVRLVLAVALVLTGLGRASAVTSVDGGARSPDSSLSTATGLAGPAAVPATTVSDAVPAASAPDPSEDATVTEVGVSVEPDLASASAELPESADVVRDGDTVVAESLVENPAGDRAVSDVLESDGFQSVGVTWPVGADAELLDPQVRTRSEDGMWSEWQDLPVSDDGPDVGSPDSEHALRAGTDPLWVGDADAVQVSFAADAADPKDMSLALVDVPEAPVVPGAAATGTAKVSDTLYRSSAAAEVTAAADAPTIISREAWGARPQVCQPAVATKLVGAVVHHTADPNTYSTVAEAMRRIRADQAYHIDGRGWCDIGYNFVVDKWGNIYEGRDNSLTQPIVGVHAGGFNTGTVGVSMLGTYSSAPSAATVRSVAQIIGWRLGYYGVDPASTMSYHTYGGQNSSIPSNTTVTLPRIIGHRDVAYTACPGNGGYAALRSIRSQASSYSFDERFSQARAVVQAMYADILGRKVDSSGLATWSAMLAGGSGLPALVAGLTNSNEYVRMRITQAYQEALGRDPEPSGLAYWYQRIRAGTATVDDVKRRFYDSDEYANRAGGDPGVYVDLLYQTMFERPASARERAYWSAQIGVLGRGKVVDAIWFSYEAALYRAGDYYRVFLKREPDAAGQAGWARLLLRTGEGAVRIGIAGSEEYRLLALKRYPGSATAGA